MGPPPTIHAQLWGDGPSRGVSADKKLQAWHLRPLLAKCQRFAQLYIRSLALTPLKGPSPHNWAWIVGGGPISVIQITLQWPYIGLYTDMITFSESVTHRPFVKEMPVFCTTLYSRFLTQIPPLTMLLPACKLAFFASDLCKLLEASPAWCMSTST